MATKGSTRAFLAANVAAAGLVGLAAYAVSTYLATENKESWPPAQNLSPPQETLGPHGFAKQWENAKGYKIMSYFWPTTAKKPKGVLLLLHGHGVHVVFEFLKSRGVGQERVYAESWIEELNNQGYSCCGIDVQSKGRSEGYKGYKNYFESFDDVVADDLAFVSKLPDLGGAAFADLPIFAFAVSMGGARAAMMFLEKEEVFKGALFYAPMLSLERVSKKGLNPYLKPVISLFNLVGPHWRMAANSKNEIYPDLQEEFDNDFFSDQGQTRVRLASEYLRATSYIMRNLKRITLPFVTFHSDGDTMTDPDGSRALYDQASSEIKEYENCPGSWHILIHEPGNERTLEKTISFLDRVNV